MQLRVAAYVWVLCTLHEKTVESTRKKRIRSEPAGRVIGPHAIIANEQLLAIADLVCRIHIRLPQPLRCERQRSLISRIRVVQEAFERFDSKRAVAAANGSFVYGVPIGSIGVACKGGTRLFDHCFRRQRAGAQL